MDVWGCHSDIAHAGSTALSEVSLLGDRRQIVKCIGVERFIGEVEIRRAHEEPRESRITTRSFCVHGQPLTSGEFGRADARVCPVVSGRFMQETNVGNL